jgi:hypothetical protein
MPQQEVSVYSGFTRPEDHIFAHLKAGAVFDAIGDYSSAVTKFTFVPDASRIAELERMVVYIEDVGAPDSGRYGNNIILTNGMKVYVRDADDEIVLDLTPDEPIKTNADWAALCYDVSLLSWGLGNDTVVVRWTFAKSGAPVYLDARDGHYLSLELNDTFTGLVSHRFLIQGIYRK